MVAEQEPWIVHAMSNPAIYDHPVRKVDRLESHISWIFLAGEFVYKIKKPVDFGFLDFSTLAKRCHFCQEELRLNRRFAPDLYLAVVPIGGDPSAPILSGNPPLEYAVKMRRFPQGCQFDRLLARGQLEVRHITEFARCLADIHRSAPRIAAEEPYGTPAAVIAPMEENFQQIRHFEKEATAERQLQQLETWTRKNFARLKRIIERRRRDGFVRECHGDIHLANIAWHEDRPLLFDCIEFNDNLRRIDVISDIAFMVMDLDDRGEERLGWHFLNHYLQGSGDYRGLALLNFYKVYRAMVRAKVNCLRLEQNGLSEQERREDLRLYHSYLDLALSYTRPRPRQLLITHGFSGSGKTTFAEQLADTAGMLHLQSDRERKRLHNIAAAADTRSPVGGGIYAPDASKATYEQLRQLADSILSSGFSAIVDATFLRQEQRDQFRDLARQQRVQFTILDFPLEKETLLERIRKRQADQQPEISEATEAVLEYQLSMAAPLGGNDRACRLPVTPGTSPEVVIAGLPELSDREAVQTQDGT